MEPSAVQEVVDYLDREGRRLPRPVLEALVLSAFQRAQISRGRAAELLGVALEEFLKLASAEGIPVFDQTPEELADDLSRA